MFSSLDLSDISAETGYKRVWGISEAYTVFMKCICRVLTLVTLVVGILEIIYPYLEERSVLSSLM